ncbi:MAG: dihydroxyacetone kinase subunit DhaL [Candidatus Limnocylindrales bacterium]|nr:dihydroxyacetone kinase subunit DhaL [Candidatus Limnocylindrales bacterium]
MSGTLVAGWLSLAAARIAAERAYLTELDAAIGDGDHGINLHRGFRTLEARLAADAAEPDAPGPLLVLAGRAITGTVGGASGALYGRALMRAGAALEARSSDRPAGPGQLVAVFWAAVDGVATLGRSRPGEKTMLDALIPAAIAFEAAGAAEADLATATRRAADAAEAGALQTLPLVATKGRASYLGERSAGHLDPGAVSSALILRALADVAAERA